MGVEDPVRNCAASAGHLLGSLWSDWSGGGFKAFWGLSRFEILRFREFCAQGGFRDFRGFGFYSIF